MLSSKFIHIIFNKFVKFTIKESTELNLKKCETHSTPFLSLHTESSENAAESPLCQSDYIEMNCLISMVIYKNIKTKTKSDIQNYSERINYSMFDIGYYVFFINVMSVA